MSFLADNAKVVAALTAAALLTLLGLRRWSSPLIARLVLAGLLPPRFARCRLQTAVMLAGRCKSVGRESRLEFDGCVGDSEAKYVSSAIRSLDKSLKALVLHRCSDLSNKGLLQIFGALQSDNNLTELDLQGCCGLGDDSLKTLGSKLTAEAHKIEALGLSRCSVSASGIAELSNTLGSAPAAAPADVISAVSLLDTMTRAKTQDSAGMPFAAPPDLPAAGLPAGLALQCLELSRNTLSGAGRSLAVLLRTLPSLRMLQLEDCGLEVEDVQQLSRALPRSGVERLDLAGNTLRSKGVVALASSLRMSNIQDLGLERNEIGLGGALAELKTAHDKRPFPGLRLEGNRLSVKQRNAFIGSLASTPHRFSKAYCPPGCKCFEGRGEVM